MIQNAAVTGPKAPEFFWKVLVAALLFLGLSLGSMASYPGGKGLYVAGNSYFFFPDGYGTTISLEGGGWYLGAFNPVYQYEWDDLDIEGNLGACVFDDLLFCFYTTGGGKLRQIVVAPPSSSSPSSEFLQAPATIADGISYGGASAVVFRDVIYVFTASHTFTSSDGGNWAVAPTGPPPGAWHMLDAVTFFPPGGDPPGVMLVYLGGDSVLRSSIFDGTSFSAPETLPYNFQLPITMGNLLLGTSKDLPGPGAKAPCIQFYGLTEADQYGDFFWGRWEYNLSGNFWTANNWNKQKVAVDFLAAAPWFETVNTTNGALQLSHMLYWFGGGQPGSLLNDSDYMVPQHNDPTYGWAGVPTETMNAGDDVNGKKLRNLWSLVGIVLGPPPFSMNGADDASYPIVLASVEYGTDEEHQVSTTHSSSSTLSVGSETKISGGLGEANLDLSYAHGWTSSHGTTNTVGTTTNFTFGPEDETAPYQGYNGWVIFNAPVLVTQRYKYYAYDNSTYLDLDMYATKTGGVVQQTAYFDLSNPGDGFYPGLFDGMPLYPHSTDLAHWLNIRDWNSGGSDWSVIFGDLSNPLVGNLSQGTETKREYTQSTSTMNSEGNSNSFSVEAGVSFDILGGFSEGITVGYDTEFKTETEIETTITDIVACYMRLPSEHVCTAGHTERLKVQPYWLQATTEKAPWIPTDYSGNLPWCITWNVLGYDICQSGTAGTAPDPGSALGTIRRGKGKGDKYEVEFGRLAWLDEYGMEQPLDMTADDFDKALGAEVALNGHVFPADGSKGKWTRNGSIWKYKTHEGVKKDPFILKLDFGSGTWYFKTTSKNLEEAIPIADGGVQVMLGLQGKHRFAHWLEHDVEATWYQKENKASWDPYGIHKIKGEYDSQTGVGHTVLKGHLPKEVESFGDMEILINGASVTIPLLATEDFLDTLFGSGNLLYQEDGLTFEMDFGKGKWKLTLEGDQFQSAMVPKGGAVRVRVLVGGKEISDQTLEIKEHAAVLSLKG